MLVLGRRKEQTIVIDDKITVKVLGWDQGQVKIGIVAPKSISVRRGEIPNCGSIQDGPTDSSSDAGVRGDRDDDGRTRRPDARESGKSLRS